MKRILIFVLVGPFVGFIVSLFPGQVMTMMNHAIFLMMLPLAYLAGAGPALVACGVDYYLSDKLEDFKRAAATSLAGYISVVAMLAVYYEQVSWWIAQVGFAGAISGVLCSLMSSKKGKNERAQ